MCAFFQLLSFEKLDFKVQTSFEAYISCPLSLPLPPLIFSYLQALIHDFLWRWACSWLIFSLKWHIQSPFLFLHSTVIDLQEANDSIDEEYQHHVVSEHLHLGDVLLLPLSFVRSIHFNSLFFIFFCMYLFHCLVVWCWLE